MVNYCWVSLKAFQFGLSICIGTLFLLPQQLKVNSEALAEGKTGPQVSIHAKHLVCFKPNHDSVFDESFPEVREGVTFNADHPDMQTIRETFGCLKYYEGDKDECLCWNTQFIISVVIIAAVTACATFCDITTILAAEGQDEQITCAQGISSCLCSVFVGCTWIITGSVVIHFVFKQWPYKYLDENGQLENYFEIPFAWTMGVVLCFSFFVIMLMEGVIYLGESGKEMRPMAPDLAHLYEK